MPTAATLTGATADEVAASRAALVGYLQALFPSLALRAGPLADLALGPAADALAAAAHWADEARASLDPEAALAAGGYDEEVLAAALAGRGVTRLAAATASGSVAMTFSTAVARTVGAGARFAAADGTAYKTTAGVRFLPPGSTAVTAGDVVLVEDPAGGYAGVTAVEAVEAGAAGNRPAGSALTAAAPAPAGLTAAVAATDLAGGADAETDAELLARLPAATAPRTAASRAGAEALVRDAVPAATYVTTIGFGDAGMRRGRSVLTSQTPGRLDVRFRVGESPGRLRVRVTATLDSVPGAHGVWRFPLAADDAPGWFTVEKVLRADESFAAVGYAPTAAPTAGYDVSGADPAPDVRSAMDAALSAYSTALAYFTDTDTATGGLTVGVSTAEYDAVVRYVPGVAAAQAALAAPAAAPAGGDALARAAAPVMVSVAAAVAAPAGVTVTAAEVRAAVAAAVNAQGVSTTLSAAAVATAAQARLPAGSTVQLSGWAGTVYPVAAAPTAATASAAGLTVTTDWATGLGPDAVAYYADETAVTATVS